MHNREVHKESSNSFFRAEFKKYAINKAQAREKEYEKTYNGCSESECLPGKQGPREEKEKTE